MEVFVLITIMCLLLLAAILVYLVDGFFRKTSIGKHFTGWLEDLLFYEEID
jgi:hypothetical protein